jgi:hypothetical protein
MTNRSEDDFAADVQDEMKGQRADVQDEMEREAADVQAGMERLRGEQAADPPDPAAAE